MKLHWYDSKTVWFNVLMTVLGIAALLEGAFPKYAAYLGAVTTVGNLILRIWFTNQPIAAPSIPPSDV